MGQVALTIPSDVSGGSTPNPSALPDIVASSSVGHSRYDLRDNLTNAGDVWADPHLGYNVIKVTDSTFPVSNSYGCAFTYGGERGPISQVWMDGSTPKVTLTAVLSLSDYGSYGGRYIIEVNLDDGSVVNKGAVTTDGDLCFVFSQDKATPRIGYYVSGGDLYRFDTDTMTQAHTGRFAHFPVSGVTGLSFGSWLHGAAGDNRFKWERNNNGTEIRVVHDVDSQTNVVESTTASPVSYGRSGWNEGYLTVDGQTEILFGTSSNYYWCNIDTPTQNQGSPEASMVHPQCAFDWMSWVRDSNQDWYIAQHNGTGWDTAIRVSTSPNIYVIGGQPANHDNHGWVIDNPDKWLMTTPDSNPSNGNGAGHYHGVLCKPGAVPVAKTAFFADNEGSPGGYYQNSMGNLGLDGRTIGWTSCMGETTRMDIFLAIMPTI